MEEFFDEGVDVDCVESFGEVKSDKHGAMWWFGAVEACGDGVGDVV